MLLFDISPKMFCCRVKTVQQEQHIYVKCCQKGKITKFMMCPLLMMHERDQQCLNSRNVSKVGENCVKITIILSAHIDN